MQVTQVIAYAYLDDQRNFLWHAVAYMLSLTLFGTDPRDVNNSIRELK